MHQGYNNYTVYSFFMLLLASRWTCLSGSVHCKKRDCQFAIVIFQHNEHTNTSCIYHCYQFVVYPCTSTRVGSKHIPGMIIPYSPVTEVYKIIIQAAYYVEVLIQMIKYPMSGLLELSLLQCFLHSWQTPRAKQLIAMIGI